MRHYAETPRYEIAYWRLQRLRLKYTIPELCALIGVDTYTTEFNALYEMTRRKVFITEETLKIIEDCIDAAEMLE